jgi:hypothetical protein
MTKRIVLIYLSLIICSIANGQDRSKLYVSEKLIEAKVGEEIKVEISKTGSGTITMDNAPKNATFIDGTFSWVVPANRVNSRIIVEFNLYDSTILKDIKSIFIKVREYYHPPKFFIQCNQPVTNGFYELHPGRSIDLAVVGYATKDSSQVSLDYYFNDREGEYHIGNGKVEIIHNQLTFKWTPLDIHLEQKYFSLTVNAYDNDGQSSQRIFLFVINKRNESPYFKFPILDEYYIHPNELLEIDLSAIDPDSDSLVYSLEIPTSIGNPKITNNTFFWQLNQRRLDELRKSFPMEVTINVTERGPELPFSITKSFLIRRGIKNEAPKILNLQNETVFEGLSFHRTIFIQDANDSFDDLKIKILGAPDGLTWTKGENLIDLEWTPGYDVIGVELKPIKFDMLLIVEDPLGAVDQKAFSLTVNYRENTEITYNTYLDYRDNAIFLIESLTQMHLELSQREDQVRNLKKSLSVITMLFATYTAAGNVFDEGSLAKEAVPYIGIMAAIAGGINAFGFNDLNKMSTLKEQAFLLKQKLMYVLALLREYQIDNANSPNLENAEFRDQLNRYDQWMIQDKLNFKGYYNSYKGLNFNRRQTKKLIKDSEKNGETPQGILFLDIDQI